MFKWGKSSLPKSSWKHKYSISSSELEYKFNKKNYQKMDDDFDLTTNYMEKNEDSIINDKNFNNNNKSLKNKRTWLSIPLPQNSSSDSNKNGSDDDISKFPESIKENDVMEWKKYVKYEIKDNEYINLNINDLLKDFLNKNKINKNNSSDHNSMMSKNKTTELYKNKTIDLETASFDKFVNDNSLASSEVDYVDSNPSNKNTPMDYDIQTIEYKLKYNSNYEVENIPEEFIMELLKSKEKYSNSMVSDSNSSTSSSPNIPPSHLQRSISLKVGSNKIPKNDNSSYSSEPTIIPQTISSDRPENNWNTLYIINEMSKFSNDNSTNNNSIFDYSSTISTAADYHQFYLDNCPPPTRKRRRSFKDALKISYKHIYNTMKLKTRRASTTVLETGHSFYDKNDTYTDIISFSDALNLPDRKSVV